MPTTIYLKRLIYLKGKERERERGRDILHPLAYFPNGSPEPGIGQAESWNQELHLGLPPRSRDPGPYAISITCPGTIADWHSETRCWHRKSWLHHPSHSKAGQLTFIKVTDTDELCPFQVLVSWWISSLTYIRG